MKEKRNSSERGQVLVLLVFGFIVLLGFSALAIDGGMVYADRRHAQNAADAASLAGGAAAALSLENSFVSYSNWGCNNNVVTDPRITAAMQAARNEAILRADSNDFDIDDDILADDDNGGVTISCGQESNGNWIDRYIDITTTISSTTQTSFAHFVYKGPLRNTVNAVTRVRPRAPVALGNAIVALNNAVCSGNQNGVIFGGSSEVNITGGGVFTNGCLTGNGDQFSVASTHNVSYAGSATGSLGNISPAPNHIPQQLPSSSYNIPAPNCSHPNAHTVNDIQLSNGSLDLAPGLYCITGSPNAIKINGGTLTGNGVTLYVINGGVTINGNAEVALSAPDRLPNPSPALPGILFYLANGNTNTIELEGNNTSQYFGMIYAPSGDVVLTGASGVHPTFHTQVIGNNVEVSGNAFIDINYNGDDNFSMPSMLELYK